MSNTNDQNWNAGKNGHSAPANNSPDATHQWNLGRQERQRQFDDAARRAAEANQRKS